MAWTGSEFEVKKIGFKFDGEDAYESVECIGSMEEDMAVKTITKKCRGVVRKKRSKGTGEGTVKLSLHIPYAIYVKAFGMDLDSLKDGVYAYGENSRHKVFSMVALVEDEDGNEKLKAYPNGVMNTGVVRKVENGAEEVAELEMEVGVMPDEFGNGLYETLVAEGDEETANEWLTAFEPEMVQVTSA
jgi:hypothetical protein